LCLRVDAGLGPASIVISLALGNLLGAPDAADSAARLVSLDPDAFDNENLLIANQGCSRLGECDSGSGAARDKRLHTCF
jgi:hypothetical protein